MDRSFALVPAAGISQRMGQPKLLLPWGNGSILDAVLRAWRESRVTATILIVRPGDEQLVAIGRQAGVQVVIAPTPPPEMKITVQLGLSFVEREFQPDDRDLWLLAPADMPRLSPPVINAVLDTAFAVPASDSPTICVPTHDGRRGHPVAFPWRLAADVFQLGATEGINALTRRYPVREFPCDDTTVLDDIDTPDDYRRLSSNSASGKLL